MSRLQFAMSYLEETTNMWKKDLTKSKFSNLTSPWTQHQRRAAASWCFPTPGTGNQTDMRRRWIKLNTGQTLQLCKRLQTLGNFTFSRTTTTNVWSEVTWNSLGLRGTYCTKMSFSMFCISISIASKNNQSARKTNTQLIFGNNFIFFSVWKISHFQKHQIIKSHSVGTARHLATI